MIAWWLYIIETENGMYYTGITTDVMKRFTSHQKGQGAKFFRSHPPAQLIFYKCIGLKSEAASLENYLKQLSHVKKKNFIETFRTDDMSDNYLTYVFFILSLQ